jgi:hypothetical protein
VGRKAKFKGKARPAELASVRAKIIALAGSQPKRSFANGCFGAPKISDRR